MEFLVVLFLINGQPTLVEGFEPLGFPIGSVCEERKEMFNESMRQMDDPPEYVTRCITARSREELIQGIVAFTAEGEA